MARPLIATHWGTYQARTDSGRLVGVEPWMDDANPSPIGHSLVGAVDGPLRVRRPAVRKGWLDQGPGDKAGTRGAEPFVEVSWDEVLKLVADELDRVRKRYGNAAIYGGSYGWASAGRFHHAQSQLHRFLNTIGGYTGSVQTYSWAAGEIVLPHVIGSTDGLVGHHTGWDSIAEHCGLIVAFGGLPARNAQVQAGGLGRHEVRRHLERCAQRGVRLVNVSPVRSDVPAGIPNEWLPLRPNTDVAVMLAIAYVLFDEDLIDTDFLTRCCVGTGKFRAYVLGETDRIPKTPAWAEAIAKVEAGRISALARDMAKTRTMIMVNWAVQRADHGEQPYWAAVALAALIGQIGLPGGGFGFGYSATNGMGRAELGFRWPSLPQGQNPVSVAIPVARISDMLLNPGDTIAFDGQTIKFPDTRIIYWAGGNPFHHHQDLNRLVRAWQLPDTVIVHEHVWNSLARHSDIVLPAATTLERNDIAWANREPLMVAMSQVIEPVGEARSEFAIFSGIAARLGVDNAFTEGRDERAWLRHMYDQARCTAAGHGFELPSFDDFWDAGHAILQPARQSDVLLGQFRADPTGHRLATPSGRIELYSERVAAFGYDDCPGQPAWLEPAEWLGGRTAARYPLHLLSCQPLNKLHSQYDHGSVSVAGKVSGRTPLHIHPRDAAARGIRSGDVVKVFNDRGACLAGAMLSEDVIPGVVQMETGAWYDPLEPGTAGCLDKHGNPNVLTLDKGSSQLAQAPSANTALVDVERWRDAVPDVTAFEPPVFAPRQR